MSPDEIREQGLWPKGFLPLPHPFHPTGGYGGDTGLHFVGALRSPRYDGIARSWRRISTATKPQSRNGRMSPEHHADGAVSFRQDQLRLSNFRIAAWT
jgi:hypothetical protein